MPQETKEESKGLIEWANKDFKMDAKKVLKICSEIGRLFYYHKVTAREAREIIDVLNHAQFTMETEEEFEKLETRPQN